MYLNAEPGLDEACMWRKQARRSPAALQPLLAPVPKERKKDLRPLPGVC
jgi:hypothetical protein